MFRIKLHQLSLSRLRLLYVERYAHLLELCTGAARRVEREREEEDRKRGIHEDGAAGESENEIGTASENDDVYASAEKEATHSCCCCRPAMR